MVSVLLMGACSVGGESPEAVLGSFREIAPPPDGGFWAPIDVTATEDRVFVLDVGAGRVYAYDPQGSFRGTIGRPGGGPGELKEPLAMGTAGDTLWVLNGGNRRIEYYAFDGASWGAQPLPDSLPPPVDLARLGSAWFATTPFGRAPVVRFDPVQATFEAFGEELEARAREIAPRKGAVPSVYRLEAVDGQLWVLHLYLPIVGIYDAGGRVQQIVVYPAAGLKARGAVEGESDGRRRRLVKAPAAPAGSLGVLETHGERYLLTQQRAGDRQALYAIQGDDARPRPYRGVSGAFLLASAARDGRNYVIATRGEDGEPAVFILE